MKMFRLFTGILALLMMVLAGCSAKSPDFTPVLKSIQISYTALKPRPSGTVAVGDQLQFKAAGLCTTPPGTKVSDADVVSKDITENGVTTTYLLKPCGVSVGSVTWTVDASGNGGIGTHTGLFTAGPGTGPVVVTGTADSLSAFDTVNVTVTPIVLDSLVVDPKSPGPIAQNKTLTFKVTGIGSDHNPFTLTPSSITWSKSCADSVATIAPTTGTSTVATAVATSGTCTITASSLNNSAGDPVAPDFGILTINNAVALKSLVGTKLSPPSDVVSVGSTTKNADGTIGGYQLFGVYGDGSTHPVPNTEINWTIAPAGVATLADHPTDSTKETATGVKVGFATITATLKDSSTLTDPTKNFATGTLTVVDAKCTAPLSNQVTPAATTFLPPITGGLCLICGVTSADNVIDADPLNFATLNATLAVGLPTNAISLNVNSNATAAFPLGNDVAFHVTDPTGALLSANVLNGQIQVATLDKDGKTVLESTPAPYVAGGLIPLPPLLDLTLLGAGTGPAGGAWVHMTTTKPYYGVQVTFSSGLVGALASVNVDTACATWDGTK